MDDGRPLKAYAQRRNYLFIEGEKLLSKEDAALVNLNPYAPPAFTNF